MCKEYMNYQQPYEPPVHKIRRWGFKSKNQLALFMVWEEFHCRNKVIFARVLFTTMDWIGF